MYTPKRKIGEDMDTYITRASKELYNNGYHISEIAKKLKCEKIYVYNSIVRKDRRITSREERYLFIKLRNEGYSISKIASICGRSETCIRKRLKTDSMVYNNKLEYILTDKELISLKRMYNKGHTLKYIAEKLNITAKAVKYRLIKCGLWEPFHSSKVEASSIEKIKFRSMYKKGIKIIQIAKECGRPYCVVFKALENL